MQARRLPAIARKCTDNSDSADVSIIVHTSCSIVYTTTLLVLLCMNREWRGVLRRLGPCPAREALDIR